MAGYDELMMLARDALTFKFVWGVDDPLRMSTVWAKELWPWYFFLTPE